MTSHQRLSRATRLALPAGRCSLVMRSCALVALWLALAAPALRSQQAEPYPGLDAYVARAMRRDVRARSS